VIAGRYVVGDWGTSRLRLFLCEGAGSIIDAIDGPGIAAVKTPFDALFESIMRPWEAQHGPLSAVLCGMIGSSIGWAQAPYVGCPADPERIIDACIALRAGRVHIIPGARCENQFRAADFMRGEETQMLGALTLDPALRHGRRLLCLPGTHTKWVLLENGIISQFLTALTGELFGALRDHSVLVPAEGRAETVGESAAFEEGVKRCNEFPQAQLLHRLFECRSRMLSGGLSAANAAAFLSGLLIAADVGGALQVFANAGAETSVYLIGEPQLTQLYAAALRHRSRGAQQLDGAAASLAGLTRVHRYIASRVATHAV
jgi:2-dehydro-3-deoxygalactonokinase